MKKIISILAILISMSSVCYSQVLISLVFGDKLNSDKLEFGLDGGLNWSNISNLEGSDYNRGFNLGFYFDIKMSKKLFLHTGVIVKSPMGSEGLNPYELGNANLDTLYANGNVSRELRYFNVPILLKYKFYDQLYIEVGPQLGLLNKAYDEFNVDVYDEDDLIFTNNTRDQYNRIDAGVTFGLGYRLMGGNGMNIGVRYYYGMVDIVKDNPGSKQLNSSFYIFAGIPIGDEKPEKN